MKQLSHLFSWIFLPLLMPLYGLLIMLFFPTESIQATGISMYLLPMKVKWIIILLFFVFSLFAPGLSFLALYRFKIISTIDMENRTERLFPLIITLIYGFMLNWLIHQSDPKGLLPKYITAIALSGIVVTVVFMFISQVIKISMHAGGAGILTGMMYVFFINTFNPSLLVLALCVLASGCVIAARWHLRKHSALELFLGYTLACIITGSLVGVLGVR